MLIHGYTVDKNLPAFRKAFFLPDILTELDNQFAIWKWVSDMCDLPHLPQTIKDRFSRLLAALSDFFGQEEYRSDWKIDQTVCFEHNAELHKQLLDCEKKINHEMKTKFQCVSYIILELLEIADYTATEQDLSIFLEYLQKQGYLSDCPSNPARQQLRIELHNGKDPKLYYGDQLVAALPDAKNYPLRGFATVAENPASGYLGITVDGHLVNGSAFEIEDTKKRPVKVLLNQMFYVILQEDGSLVHNLRFCTELPSVPVRDVTLNQEDIRWTPME